MSSFFRAVSALYLALFALTSSAFAQPSELVIPADKDWQHEWTPMTFPARIGDFERERVLQFEERQTNVAANYWDNGTKTILSIYIYRPGNPDSAIWFDRALISIGARDIYGDVDLDDIKVGSFVPNGGTVESGQFAVLKPRGQFRSTAVSLYRAGEWLVKLRISSEELSVGKMDELLHQTLSNLPELSAISQVPAYFIAPCDSTLSRRSANSIEVDTGISAILGISIGASAARLLSEELEGREGGLEPQSPPTFCREGDRATQFNIYRPDQSEERYFIAVSDAGFGVNVAPDTLQALLENEEGERDPIVVTSSTGLDTIIHAVFDGTPNVEQAIAAVNSGARIGSVDRPLGDEGGTITVVTSGDGDDSD